MLACFFLLLSNKVLSRIHIALINKFYLVIMWSYSYTTLYAHVIPKFPIDKLFRHNRKSQEACIMCPHSSRQFLPFTALSNYVFTFQENIFQLPLTRCEKIVTFNVFIHSSVCLFFLCPFWGWEFMFLWTNSFSFKEKWYWPDLICEPWQVDTNINTDTINTDTASKCNKCKIEL